MYSVRGRGPWEVVTVALQVRERAQCCQNVWFSRKAGDLVFTRKVLNFNCCQAN